MEVSGQLLTPAASLLGKQLPRSIRQEAGWAFQPACGRYAEEDYTLPLPGIEPGFLGLPARSLVGQRKRRQTRICYEKRSMFFSPEYNI
jgi:hypothetical protein